MPLDPEVEPLLARIMASGHELTLEAARGGGAGISQVARQPLPIAHVEDISINGERGPLQLRAYHPAPSKRLPVLIWLHGGGWIRGDIAAPSIDGLCRNLANKAEVAIISVNYRLAPEHPYPAALNDSMFALNWVCEHADRLHVDPSRIGIGGDSAGANLAAAAAIAARDAGGPELGFQLLVCPITDLTCASQSYIDNGEGYMLTGERMRWYRDLYLQNDAPALLRDPLVSPLHVADAAGLPPAHIITAEYDPLRDEGEAYGAKLQAAGVRTTVRRYDGQIHGFIVMPDALKAARDAVNDAAAALAVGMHGASQRNTTCA